MHGSLFPRSLGLLLLTGLVVAALIPTAPQANESAKTLAPDTSLIAAAGSSYLSVAVGALREHPLMRQAPPRLHETLKELESELPERIGVKLDQIERFHLALPVGKMQAPVSILVGKAKNGFDAATIQKVATNWKKVKVGEREILRNPDTNESLCLVNQSLLVLGDASDVASFLALGKVDATLSRGLAEVDAGAHLVVGLRPVDLMGAWLLRGSPPREVAPLEQKKAPDFKDRGPFDKKDDGPGARRYPISTAAPPAEPEGPPSVEEAIRGMPPEALPYKPLFLAKTASLSVKLGEDSASVRVEVDFGKPEAVRDGEASLRTLLYVVRESLPRLWLQEIDRDPRQAIELVRSIDRLIESLRKAEIKVEGSTIHATMTVPLEQPLVTMALRQMNFGSPGGIQRQNNLKQVGIALHNYHDTMGIFPGTASYSMQGQPLLSWRVAILPYIEEANLYKQFKQDEPWDGPNNKKLLERMPKIYAPPRGVKAEPGHTFVQGFSGEGAMFDVKRDRKQGGAAGGIRFTDVTDGLSNTAMVGESGKAVPWTKPDDIPCDGKAVPVLGCVPTSDRCYVLMGDGSVFAITTKPNKNLFYNLVIRHDGNVLNIDDLKPGR